MKSETQIREEIKKIKEHIIEVGSKPMFHTNIAGYEKTLIPNDFADRLMIKNFEWVLKDD